MTLTYTLRPISDRTAFTGPPLTGQRNPFDASWPSTLDLLERELHYLDARRVVLEIDVREQDLKMDGTLRANARTEQSPAARLAFESIHGPLVYATDRYGWNYSDRPMADGWKQNVRAIALGMEALRRVDRYGITKRGEQYRGFKAIGSGVATSMTTDLALEVLRREAHAALGAEAIGSDPALIKEALRHAIRLSHPDRNNGDRSRWDAVEQAANVLKRAGMLS